MAQGMVGYRTTLIEVEENVLHLSNGAVVEVYAGYLGYVGYGRNVVVWASGSACRIWIEDKDVYGCSFRDAPPPTSIVPIQELMIFEILDDGELLRMSDGSVYSVLYESYITSIWLNYGSVLLVGCCQMIPLSYQPLAGDGIAVGRIC